jgi:hypothetical protein
MEDDVKKKMEEDLQKKWKTKQKEDEPKKYGRRPWKKNGKFKKCSRFLLNLGQTFPGIGSAL